MEDGDIQLIDKFKIEWDRDPRKEMSRLQRNWKISSEYRDFFRDLVREHEEYLRSLGREYEIGFLDHLGKKYEKALQSGNRDEKYRYERMMSF